MIPSIEIKNYRNLKDFNIKFFGRVNLIGGKNNTGKSSILEALWLFTEDFSKKSMILRKILIDKGERKVNYGKAYALLFTRGVFNFKGEQTIKIGFGDNYFIITFIIPEITNTVVNGVEMDMKPKLKISYGEQIKYFSSRLYEENDNLRQLINKTLFVSSKGIGSNMNQELWSKITLTDKENYVIEALKIIEPKAERINFRQSEVIVKLQYQPEPVPLLSMGDGINRILTIILALVNAENGYLLIDEFENGLHYSVQSKLWEIVFFLSEKLNIQVFATTHSNDCIAGFTEILNKADNQTTGRFIRLENKNGEIKEVDFDKDELKIAMEAGIEIR